MRTSETSTNNKLSNKLPIADPTSHDLDSLGIIHPDGTREAVRQPISGFVEVDSGNPLADKDTNMRKALYDKQPITDINSKGKGTFDRTLMYQGIANIDKTMIDFLSTDYHIWANYGLPKKGTPEYEQYKYFDDSLMENNEEAAQLLRDNPDPTTVLSDKSYLWVSERVELLRKAYQTGDYKDVHKLRQAAVDLSDNRSMVIGYKKRMWLDDMSTNTFEASIIKERGTGSSADLRYQENKANTSIDLGTRKDKGFWNGVAKGFNTSMLGTVLSKVHTQYDDDALTMEAWLRDNNDKDPQFLRTAWNSYMNGNNPQIAINEAVREEATYEYQSHSKNVGMLSNIGLGVGEFGSNPINWLLANPVIGGAKIVASKAPTIIQPLITGVTIGASESLINDFTAGHNLTTEQKTERALWNAAAGGTILTLIQGSKASISSYADHLKRKANDPKLIDSVTNDTINDPLTTASMQTAENNKQALVRAKAEAGRRQRIQEQADSISTVRNTWEKSYQEAVNEVEGLTVPQSKSLLKEVYEELGERGFSKFRTKEAITKRLATMRSKQASIAAKSKQKIEAKQKARRESDNLILKKVQEKGAIAEKELAAKAKSNKAANAKAKVEKEVLEAQDALDMAVINKQRLADNKPPYKSIDDKGYADDVVNLRQDRAVEDALEDAANVTRVRKTLNAFAQAYKHLTKNLGLRDMTTKGLDMDDGVVKYIALNVLESGAGYAGRASRPATAALIKDTVGKKVYSNIMGAYQDSMNSWARDKGLNYVQNVNARNQGQANKYADEFHKEVYLTQERLAMGDSIDINPHIQKYLTTWDKEMADIFKEARDAGVNGFGKNQRKHYQARVWNKAKVANISNLYGEENLRTLLKQSMESAERKGKLFDKQESTMDELIDRQLNWINGLGDAMTSYKVGANARTKARMPLDMTVSINLNNGKQLRMIDLVNTDIPSASATYTNRLSGSIGLARATNGAVRDEAEFALLAAKAGTPEAKQFMKDTQDMIFGYPTREGMNPAIRMVMDAAQYAQLETLGVAQLATVGTSLQAVVSNWVSNPKVAESILKMAGGGDKNLVMRQIRERSAVNNNIKFTNRADVHTLDQAQIEDISKYSIAMNAAVDKLTGGKLKSTLSRGLGKLSGYDAIAQYQSKLTQASFTTETARQVVRGSSSFSDARLIDLGVYKIKDGVQSDTGLSRAYKEHVEFSPDGELKDMHFEKWSDDQMREYAYSMNRYEAQVMPYIMAGELPQFMNMPEMQFALHYLKTPLAFGTKGTARQLGFADKEAAVAVAMNTLSAGLVRYAYVTGTGAVHSALVGEEFDASPDASKMKIHNYLDWFGYMGEIGNKGSAVYNAINTGSMDSLGGEVPPAMKDRGVSF